MLNIELQLAKQFESDPTRVNHALTLLDYLKHLKGKGQSAIDLNHACHLVRENGGYGSAVSAVFAIFYFLNGHGLVNLNFEYSNGEDIFRVEIPDVNELISQGNAGFIVHPVTGEKIFNPVEHVELRFSLTDKAMLKET